MTTKPTCTRRTCGRLIYRAGLCEQHYELTPHGMVDATRSREHLERLHAAGLGWRRLEQLTGLSRPGLQMVGRWTPTATVTVDTEQRILAVPVPAAIVAGGASLPAHGTGRRLRALYRIGYQQEYLARSVGVSGTTLRRIAVEGTPKVNARTAAATLKVFNELHMTPGPDQKTAVLAAERGWPPPFAWDEDTIDDPKAKPDLGRADCRFVDRYLDIVHHAGIRDQAQIADRLGIEVISLERQMTRHREALAS